MRNLTVPTYLFKKIRSVNAIKSGTSYTYIFINIHINMHLPNWGSIFFKKMKRYIIIILVKVEFFTVIVYEVCLKNLNF